MKPDEKPILRILQLEDSDFDAELIIRELRKGGIDFIHQRVQTQADFEKELLDFNPDIILADYRLPNYDGGQALVTAKECLPEVPVLVISGAVGEDTAVELLKQGATDFLLKDRISGRLVPSLQRAMDEVWSRRARREAEAEREQLMTELRHLATHDQLTGAASRSLMIRELEASLREVDPLNPQAAFFSIDLDRFKWVNDTYGNSFGDQLLIETARRLNSICRPRDLLGNFGGDKFFLLVRHFVNHDDLDSLLKKLQGCFKEPFTLHDIKIRLHASIGGVLLNSPDAKSSDVMLLVDEAMRMVKNKLHQGIFLANDVLIRELHERQALDRKVLEAIEKERFFLVFQPIVELSTGTVRGAEVLLRLREEDGSVLSAGSFIDSLTRTKHLLAMDEWVFAHFLELISNQGRYFLERKGFRFSLNMSPAMFSGVDFADTILSSLEKKGISPHSLTLEILESGIQSYEGTFGDNLRKLRDRGILIAVDDFGTGHSNLMRLSKLPIDELKIDRSFLGGIASGDAQMNSVLNTAVAIAKNLDYIIVAEGIEKKEESDYLKTLGCQYGQGYLFAKGMMIEDLIIFCRESNAHQP